MNGEMEKYIFILLYNYWDIDTIARISCIRGSICNYPGNYISSHTRSTQVYEEKYLVYNLILL